MENQDKIQKAKSNDEAGFYPIENPKLILVPPAGPHFIPLLPPCDPLAREG
jgi:hypothetical protein